MSNLLIFSRLGNSTSRLDSPNCFCVPDNCKQRRKLLPLDLLVIRPNRSTQSIFIFSTSKLSPFSLLRIVPGNKEKLIWWADVKVALLSQARQLSLPSVVFAHGEAPPPSPQAGKVATLLSFPVRPLTGWRASANLAGGAAVWPSRARVHSNHLPENTCHQQQLVLSNGGKSKEKQINNHISNSNYDLCIVLPRGALSKLSKQIH